MVILILPQSFLYPGTGKLDSLALVETKLKSPYHRSQPGHLAFWRSVAGVRKVIPKISKLPV